MVFQVALASGLAQGSPLKRKRLSLCGILDAAGMEFRGCLAGTLAQKTGSLGQNCSRISIN